MDEFLKSVPELAQLKDGQMCDPMVSVHESYGEPLLMVAGWIPILQITEGRWLAMREQRERGLRESQEIQVAALRKERPDLFQ